MVIEIWNASQFQMLVLCYAMLTKGCMFEPRDIEGEIETAMKSPLANVMMQKELGIGTSTRFYCAQQLKKQQIWQLGMVHSSPTPASSIHY